MANDLSAFIPQVWSRRIINNINQINVAMAVMANTNYEGEIQAAGDTVQVRTFGNITVSTYTRGLPLVPQSIQPTKETLVVNNSQYFAFDVDSLDIAQNDINAIDGYTQRAGVAMSNTIDTFVMAKMLNGNAANTIGTTTVPIAITADTAGTSVYEQLILAGRKLDQLNVPTDSRWAIVTPFFKSLLMTSTKYLIRSTEMGDAIVRTAGIPANEASRVGFFGQVAGFDVYMSNNTPTNATYWANGFGQGKCVCYAAQIPPSTLEAIRLETTFATRVRGLLLQGVQVFAEDAKRLGVIYTTNA
jgi:hypothetical protein